MAIYVDPPPPKKRNIRKRTSINEGLPAYMEARPRKKGGASYRMRLQDGRIIPLGWNLDEALQLYSQISETGLANKKTSLEWAEEMHKRHSAGAKQRKIEYTLTEADLVSILDAQAGKCALTDIVFSTYKPEGARIRPWAPSLDRIDPKGIYSAANCRIVCAFVNVALNEFGEEIFFGLLEKMMRRVAREEVAAAFKNLGVFRSPFPNGKGIVSKKRPPKTDK